MMITITNADVLFDTDLFTLYQEYYSDNTWALVLYYTKGRCLYGPHIKVASSTPKPIVW